MSGVDSGVVICSIAGGLVFSLSSVEIPVFMRCLYLPVAALCGYFCAAEVSGVLPILGVRMAAFFTSAFCIITAKTGIRMIKGINISDIFRR